MRATSDGAVDATELKAFLSEALTPTKPHENTTSPAANNPSVIHPDLQAALQTANKQGKRLVVDFYGDRCPWCGRMDRTLADPKIKALLTQKFYYCKMDIGHFDLHKDCVKHYNVAAIPFMMIFNHDGTVCTQNEGFMDTEQFNTFLANALKTASKK